MTISSRFVLGAALLAALAMGRVAWAQSPAPDAISWELDTPAPEDLEPVAAPGAVMDRHPDAAFYEVVENMWLVGGGNPGTQPSLVPKLLANRATTTSPRRVAKAALFGWAVGGTPFCPNANVCDLTAFGHDDVDLVTAQGTFRAKIAQVVQGDNPVDAPELVVAQYRVSGDMDFSPALMHELPYGTVIGKVTSSPTRSRFIGVFRLPFLASPAIRGALCPLTPDPNPHFPDWDVAYVDTTPNGTLTGRCIDIIPEELSIGWPTVRFDLWFE